MFPLAEPFGGGVPDSASTHCAPARALWRTRCSPDSDRSTDHAHHRPGPTRSKSRQEVPVAPPRRDRPSTPSPCPRCHQGPALSVPRTPLHSRGNRCGRRLRRRAAPQRAGHGSEHLPILRGRVGSLARIADSQRRNCDATARSDIREEPATVDRRVGADQLALRIILVIHRRVRSS